MLDQDDAIVAAPRATGVTGEQDAALVAEHRRLRALVTALQQQSQAAGEACALVTARSDELELVVQSMPQIVWITRPDGWHTYYNQEWLDFTGLTLEESLGHGWNPPFHPDDRARAAARWAQATSTGEPYEIEYRLRRHDGVYHWMLGRARPLRDANGDIVKWFGTCTDIEELKQAEVRISEQAQLLDLTQDAIFVKDLEHRLVYWNSGAERTYGWSPAEAVGRRLDEIVCPDRTQIDLALAEVHAQGEWSGELRFVHRSGETRVVDARWTLLRHPDGTPKGVLAVNTDVTQRRATEAQFIAMLEAEATHDALTGLPNRTLLTRRLEQALEAGAPPVSLLFLDLDGFKDVNDGAGHLLGDKVLTEVAIRLENAVREQDTVARFGGDEFVVLLPETDVDVAGEIAERLLAAVRGQMEIDGQRLHVSASIGVAASPPVEPEALLRAADAALYYAKSQGRAQVRPFLGELSTRAEQRLQLSGDLADALQDDALRLVYQPVVDLASGGVLGVEALCRWQHPERGAVSPDLFVAVAQQSGLGRRLDDWVLRRACREFAGLRTAGTLPLTAYLAVNVTASSTGDAGFLETIESALVDAGLPPEVLVLEVTETELMTGFADGVRALTLLRERGVRIAIDDFGTGWSSLAYLKRLPANIIKLDRTFVARLHQDEDDQAIAASVIRLGQATGLTVVAEGIETKEQLAVLRQLRCTAGQGYLWHAGVPAEELAAALASVADTVERTVDSESRPARIQAVADVVDSQHGLDLLLQLHEQGASAATIAAALNRHGYRTPRGMRWHGKAVSAALARGALEATPRAV